MQLQSHTPRFQHTQCTQHKKGMTARIPTPLLSKAETREQATINTWAWVALDGNPTPEQLRTHPWHGPPAMFPQGH